MHAHTVAQLQDTLGEYIEPNGKSFTQALRQVLPRLYQMGLWRDLTYEVSLPNTVGYVSLPDDTDAVLACTINNSPRPVRSMWHDIRITGRTAILPMTYGIVDAGYSPVLLDMKDVEGVDTDEDVAGATALNAIYTGTSDAVDADDFTGEIKITYIDVNGKRGIASATTTGDLVFTPSGDPIAEIVSVTFTDANLEISLVSDDFPTKVIATIPVGSGVLRYRRFRTASVSDTSVIHLLLKRSCPAYLDDDTVIHLGNLSAIKYGLLGLIAEDNADGENAEQLWGRAEALLDKEIQSILGAAKPTMRLDFGPAPGIHNLM